MAWKKVGKKLLFPPLWLMALLVMVSAAALCCVFMKGWTETIIGYITYVLSFYTLSVISLFCALVLPKKYSAMKQRIYNYPLGRRYMTDRVFRTKVALSLSLLISMLYVGVNLLSWYSMQSYWFLVLAVYYGIMAVMRFLLVRYVRIQRLGTSMIGEWKRSRICACILLLINLSLSGAVLMILYQNKGYDYPGVLIYVMALYTFYSMVHAMAEMVKYRKLGSPVMSTAKVISLSAALVSMLNLETAMFAQFGADMPLHIQRLFIILTGAGVSAVVITLSVLRIVKATKEIRRENNGE